MADTKKDGISNYDMTIYNIKRENMFKATILMCIIYAIFAFILIIAAYVSENIKTLLFERFLPFTLIYIIGTIIIILIFVGLIFSFKVEKIDDTSEYPKVSCPDYWKLELVNDYDTSTSFDTANYDNTLFKYKCVMDDRVFDKYSLFTSSGNTSGSDYEGDRELKLTNISKNLKAYDKYDSTKSSELKNINDNGYFKYADLYKDINKVDYNNDKIKKLFNDNYKTADLQNHLIDTSYTMNNYKLDNNKYKPINNSSSNLSYNIPPIIYSTDTHSTPIDITATADDNTSAIIDWNGYSVEKHMELYGIQPVNLYVKGKTNAIKIGEISVNSSNTSLTYKKYNTNITTASIATASSIDSTNGNNIFKAYIYTGSASPTNSDIVNYMNNKNINSIYVILYKILPDVTKDSTITNATTVVPLVCNRLYPAFLAHYEDKNNTKNKLRCAYSKICGVTWSDMNCK